MADNQMVEAKRILEIHPDSRYVLLLPTEDDAMLIQASEVISNWWAGKNGATPILLIPSNIELRRISPNKERVR